VLYFRTDKNEDRYKQGGIRKLAVTETEKSNENNKKGASEKRSKSREGAYLRDSSFGHP
jgi:hypothetical protein